MVLLQAAVVGREGRHVAAPKVRHGVNFRLELVDGEERGEVGGVGVGDDEDEKRIGGDDDARGEGVHGEDVDGEDVRDGVPEGLVEGGQRAEAAVVVGVDAPVATRAPPVATRARIGGRGVVVRHAVGVASRGVGERARLPEKTASKKTTMKGTTGTVMRTIIQTLSSSGFVNAHMPRRLMGAWIRTARAPRYVGRENLMPMVRWRSSVTVMVCAEMSQYCACVVSAGLSGLRSARSSTTAPKPSSPMHTRS